MLSSVFGCLHTKLYLLKMATLIWMSFPGQPLLDRLTASMVLKPTKLSSSVDGGLVLNARGIKELRIYSNTCIEDSPGLNSLVL